MEQTHSSELSVAYSENVIPYLEVIDQLRNLGIEKDIPIPQIAVMGDQSSGKSSVLEALSGIPFPRGSGLVTRCATQIRLTNGEDWKASVKVVREEETDVDLKEEVLLPDKESVGKKIEEITTTLTGDCDFTYDSIEIKVQSPDLPNLTLVDLPGIVRTATNKQDKSVIAKVDNLLNKFLVQERTVILAVIPANQDIATIDILERALKVDPEGSRTLGVLTKPDLVDEGSENNNVICVVNNEIKYLRLGYVVVKNRSQKELEAGLAEKDLEMDYFSRHPVYSTLDKSRVGIKSLSLHLSDILVGRIKDALPAIITQIENQLETSTKELSKLGGKVSLSSNWEKLRYLEHDLLDKLDNLLQNSGVFERLYRSLQELIEGMKRELVDLRPDFDGEKESYHCVNAVQFKEYKICKTTYNAFQYVRSDEQAKQYIYSYIKNKGLTTLKLDYCKYNKSQLKCNTSVLKENDRVWYDGKEMVVMDVITGDTLRNEIFKILKENKGRELPGFLNFKVFVIIFSRYVDSWVPVVEKAQKEVLETLQHQVKDTITNDVLTKRFPKLDQRLLNNIDIFIKNQAEEFNVFFKKMIEKEKAETLEVLICPKKRY